MMSNNWDSILSPRIVAILAQDPLPGLIQRPLAYAMLIILILLASCLLLQHSIPTNKHLPMINRKKWFDLLGSRSRKNFYQNGIAMLQQGQRAYDGKPFRMLTDMGEYTILPSKFADEVRSGEAFAFEGPLRRVSELSTRACCL